MTIIFFDHIRIEKNKWKKVYGIELENDTVDIQVNGENFNGKAQ